MTFCRVFNIVYLVQEASLSTVTVIEEETRNDTQPQMISQEDFDVFVCVNESNDLGSPTGWRRNVQKCKDSDLKDNEPEKENVNELDHFVNLYLQEKAKSKIYNQAFQYQSKLFQFLSIELNTQQNVNTQLMFKANKRISHLQFNFSQFISFLFLVKFQMESELTAEQYEIILKYMEATSEEDFQTATLMLKQYNFNINTAINAKFNGAGLNGNRQSQMNQNRNYLQQNNQQNDEQIIRQYIQHLQKQNQNYSIIETTFNFAKNFVIGLVKLISEIILPQNILKKVLRSAFYVLYKNQIKINFQDDKFNRVLMNTKQLTYKSCFLVISPTVLSQSIKNLLSKDDIVKKIQQNFYFIGFVAGDNQIRQVENQSPPQVIICRYNIYKQLITLKRFIGDSEINSIDISHLNRLVQQGRNLHKRDKNVLIKYRNFIRRQYYGPMQIQEQEQQEINFVVRENTSHHIRQQNEEYRRIEEEQIKRLQQKKKQQQHKSKIQEQFIEIEQQRKVRKMSIPDEPIEGDIIRFLFRCPDGTTKNRNFAADQNIQILYHWVQTNEQIQLQDNKKRQFEILYSYPPTPLTNMKDKKMKDVFESNQQKLLIRQL